VPAVSDLLGRDFGCRGHGLLSATADGRFPLPGDKPHYPRDRAADIKHVERGEHAPGVT
jgi:hypothetical protein